MPQQEFHIEDIITAYVQTHRPVELPRITKGRGPNGSLPRTDPFCVMDHITGSKVETMKFFWLKELEHVQNTGTKAPSSMFVQADGPNDPRLKGVNPVDIPVALRLQLPWLAEIPPMPELPADTSNDIRYEKLTEWLKDIGEKHGMRHSLVSAAEYKQVIAAGVAAPAPQRAPSGPKP